MAINVYVVLFEVNQESGSVEGVRASESGAVDLVESLIRHRVARDKESQWERKSERYWEYSRPGFSYTIEEHELLE